MRSAGLFCLFSGLAACTAVDAVWLERPNLEGAATVILAIHSETLSVLAFDRIAPGEPLEQVLQERGTVKVEIAGFRERLTELDLSPGVVSPADGGRRLPATPAAAYTATVDEARNASTWIETKMLSPDLAGFRYPVGPWTCPEYSSEQRLLPPGYGISLALPLGAGRFLVSGNADEAFLLDLEQENPIRTTLDYAATSGFAVAEGELWLVDTSARLHRVRLRGDVLETVTSTRPSAGLSGVDAIAGGPTAAGEELYLLNYRGELYHRLGDAPFTLVDRLPETHDRLHSGSLVWLGPGEVIAGWSRAGESIRVQGNQVTRLQPTFRLGVDAMAWIDGLGVIAGAGDGGIYALQESEWVELVNHGTSDTPVDSLSSFRGGLNFARDTVLLRYVPALGLCPMAVPGGNIKQIRTWGDRVLIFSSREPPAPRSLLVLEPLL